MSAQPTTVRDPDELVAGALARGDVALLVAIARTGHHLPRAALPLLAGLHADGLEAHDAEADGCAVLALATETIPELNGLHPPPVLTTPRLRQALLALLAATRPEAGRPPYPGTPALVEDIVALTRPSSAAAGRHIKGALRQLAVLGYCTLEDTVEGEVARPGPLLVSWSDAWARDDLPLLLERIQP